MTNYEYILITFTATFSGVFLSFLFWFVGRWLIRRQHNRQLVEHMMREIREELKLNMALLRGFAQSIITELQKGNISFYLPHRMQLGTYQHIVSSGEIRLLSDIGKQRWIITAGALCERFNKFVDNTEMLLASLLGKPAGQELATYRLKMLAEQAQENIHHLQKILDILSVSKQNKEKEMEENNKNELESDETRLGKIEKGINDIKKQLKDNEKTSTFHFGFVLGIALIAIATGITAAWSGWATTGLDLPSVAFVIMIGGVLIIVMSAWEYQGRYRKKLGISGLLTMFIGALLVVSSLLFDFAIMPLVKLGGLIFVVVGLNLMIFSIKLRRT